MRCSLITPCQLGHHSVSKNNKLPTLSSNNLKGYFSKRRIVTIFNLVSKNNPTNPDVEQISSVCDALMMYN